MNCRILSMLFLFIIHSTVFSQSKKDKKKKLVADTITELKAYQEGDIGNIQEDSELENTNYVVQNNCPTCKENLIRFEKTVSGNTKYGYKTKYDQVIIPAVFDVADYRFNSTYDYSVVGIGELKGIINHMGDFLVPLKYQYIQSLKDDLFTVTNNSGKKGIIDIKNKEILSMVYDEIYTRGENLLILKSRDMCSLRSLNDMKIIIQGNYDDIKIQDDKLSIIGYKKNDKKFWYEWPSLNLIDTSYTKINMIQNGNYLVCKKNKYGIVNVKNEVIVPIIYDDLFINWEQPSLFTAKLNGKMGLITDDNRVVVEFKYDNIKNQNGCYVVSNNDKYGIVDQLLFKETTPCIYDEVYVATTQRILARKGKYFGIIRYNNEIVKDFNIEIFTSGISDIRFPILYKAVKYYGILDKRLNDVVSPDCDKIEILQYSYYEYKFLIIKKNTKTVINSSGEFLADVSSYDDIYIPYSSYSSGTKKYLVVKKGNNFGLIDYKSNKEVLSCTYDMVAVDNINQIIVVKNNIYYKCVFDENGAPQLILIK